MQEDSSVVRTQGLEQRREQLPTTARMQELEQRKEQLPTTARTQELEQRNEQLPTTARTQELEQRKEQLPTTARTQELEQRKEQLPTTARTQELEQRREQLPTTARTQELEQRREQLPTTARTQELEQRREQLPRAPKVGALVDTGKYYVKKQKVEGVSAINEINLQKNPPALLSNKSDLSNNTSSKFYAFKNSAENSTIPKKKKSTISIDNVNILMLHFQWPIKGKILKAFSQADNKGIDIAGQMGLAVSAAEAGTVVYSGQGLMGYGNVLIIKHNDLFLSAYANNSQLLVVEGSTVKKGEVIAKVGQSGSNKTSLHFEIRKNGKPVNPVNFLPEK
jgi:murein DD-endopeptidase MepM/ murein hydrolase activator NlpD